MGRDAMFAMLCGMLGAQGRDRSLLGQGGEMARQAFARMAPEGRGVHAYFELPLLGPRGLDVHCSVSEAVPTQAVPEAADPAWKDALAWFSGVAPATARGGEVLLMTEADASALPASRPGSYLIQRDRADLVGPYLEALGEAGRPATWGAFCERLPRGWETSYVGLFPGRDGGLLRVNAHPASPDAAGLVEAVAALGLNLEARALDLCRALIEGSLGFDLQLDVHGNGAPVPDFGLEVYLDTMATSVRPWENGQAERAFGLLEEAGAADGRWRDLSGVDVSRRVALPGTLGMRSCAVSLRTFSAKVRFTAGRPALAKAYLRGDALMDARPALWKGM